jgi:7-keto-8-aminopelargonate synthetase-like enzyme
MKNPSPELEAKRDKLKRLLELRKNEKSTSVLEKDYQNYTYDMFLHSMGKQTVEMDRFLQWVSNASDDGIYAFESARTSAQRTEVDLVRETGEKLHLLNFSSYNYLGFGYHPAVIKAAQDAVSHYGLGASSSPVISGTYSLHKELEQAIIDYFDLPNRGVSLFSSGYSVNLGVIQAYISPGNHVICDKSAHMSILDGAKLSGGKISYFNHNDPDDLDRVLKSIYSDHARILVCIEGIYSGDGDYGRVKEMVRIAKRYDAAVLVDEAHSVLLAGDRGRGVCEMQGVLEDVDLYVMTFSKAFGGVGGALLAHKNIVRYVNWYAKCRMFSCALDPAVTGGMLKVVELAKSHEGHLRRQRLKNNADCLKALLEKKVDLGKSETWIITVMFGDERKTLALNDYLQRHGLDTSIMQFPAVPKNEARIRMFATSEHTGEQIQKASDILLQAAEKFNFLI